MQYDKNKNIINTFDSFTDASLSSKIPASLISDYCNNKLKQKNLKEFIFELVTLEKINTELFLERIERFNYKDNLNSSDETKRNRAFKILMELEDEPLTVTNKMMQELKNRLAVLNL